MIKSRKTLLFILSLISIVFFSVNSVFSLGGLSTEENHQKQVEKDDAIVSKPYDELTMGEKMRLRKIENAQMQKRTWYEKRARNNLKNTQPKTYDEYHKVAADFRSEDMADVSPTFKRDERLEKVPEVQFEVVRYNYPAGSKEINLSNLKTKRYARGQGVLSPDNKYVVFTEVNYEVGLRKSTSSAYLIPVNSPEYRAKKRVEYVQKREDEIKALNESLENNLKSLSPEEKKAMKQRIKKLRSDIEVVKNSNNEQEKEELKASTKDTPAQKSGKALMNAHIKDRIKTPILSVGLDDSEYGVQRSLTVVDWSLDSQRILFKEKIGQDGSGIWQTNLWVYDLETGESKKLDEIRQAIEYYWKKDRLIDLHYYRYDLYPLGWDAQHSKRILLYAYGYTKRKNEPPKFLGTWSIDYKGEQSRLISVTKTGYILQANGFCLKAKNIDYYEK